MIQLHTTSGLVQTYPSQTFMIEYLNRNGRHYVIRGLEVWHKGQNRKIGEIVS